MDKSKKREMERREGRLQVNIPPIVSLQEWGAQVERGIRAGQGRRRP